jgi:hypothetical protein
VWHGNENSKSYSVCVNDDDDEESKQDEIELHNTIESQKDCIWEGSESSTCSEHYFFNDGTSPESLMCRTLLLRDVDIQVVVSLVTTYYVVKNDHLAAVYVS